MMNKELIKKEFAPELIKTRRGSWGDSLVYVETCEYIRRLNDVFNHQWDWVIESIEDTGRTIICKGKLTAEGVTKHAFGGAQKKCKRDSSQAINLADDYKAAASDALKKACSLFGIGLHLWSEEQVDEPDDPASVPGTLHIKPTENPEEKKPFRYKAVKQPVKSELSNHEKRVERVVATFKKIGVSKEALEASVGAPDAFWKPEDFEHFTTEIARAKNEGNSFKLKEKQ